ncbi:hypothetical protein CPC16_002667 [Podila verticillata]|nr:hypothetical protein CPC16_002667 [Podila verticillata]
MFNNRHANLWRLRLLLIPFTLVVGALFAAARSLSLQEYADSPWDPREIAATVISFISFITYVYAVWGATRVPTKGRTFLVFCLTYGLLFCCMSPLFEIQEIKGWDRKTTLGCWPGYDDCQVGVTAQILGSITGFIMLLEVIMTGRLGPLDHSLRKHQYKSAGGYQQSANVVIVRPDYIPIQPPMVQVPVQPSQVLAPMQQPSPYQLQPQMQPQMQPQYPYPQHEEIQHHPLPQSPQVIESSTSTSV